MEAIVYRNDEGTPLPAHLGTSSMHPCMAETQPLSAPGDMGLQPELFYPTISDAEMNIWRHWLPTTRIFARGSWMFPDTVVNTLERHHAPPEVLEEFRWASTMGLFDAYEIRTPQRRDLRDPLLIGMHGKQRYRIALWGESLRPFEEITTLVQDSLSLRARAAKQRTWLVIGGTLTGLCTGLWLGRQASFEGDPIGAGILFAVLSFFVMWLLFQAYTPENRQQQFLDRYRREHQHTS